MYCCFPCKERKTRITFEWSPLTCFFDTTEIWERTLFWFVISNRMGCSGQTTLQHLKSEQCASEILHGPVMSILNMYHSIIKIMKKSRAGGRHKWRWHKKTERAVFSLFAIANTKARGEALIEATEWHAQSNWISSAVSSNLIWPALWRMTGERNTFSCLPLPLGVPHTQSDPQTCRFHTTTGQHLLRGLPLLTA